MSANHLIGSSVIEFDQLDSTNDYAMQLANGENVEHGTAIITKYQTKGKGQQGRNWHASPEKNLLISVILDTTKHNIQSQFELNAAFCSAMAHMLMEDYEVSNVSIKWPNDLYVGRNKIAGILIENIIRGQQWQYAIVGMGINVNETSFPEELQATSIQNELKNELDIISIRKKLFVQLNKAYEHYLKKDLNLIAEYNTLLHGFEQEIKFEKEGQICSGRLKGADSYGFLTINDQQYRHGEIKLLL